MGDCKQTSQKCVYDCAEEAADYLKSFTHHRPQVAIICGSGLGGLADTIKDPDVFEYKDIPHFPVSTVAGHKGRLVFGVIGGKAVMCMQGRTHTYEGHSQNKVTFPVYVMTLFGIRTLIVTNAAGGLNPDYKVGDIMIIKDHISLAGMSGNNPLVGPHDHRFGARFTPLSSAYDNRLQFLAKSVSRDLGMDYIREGVYVLQSGPCYETVAEARMLRLIGADVSGMSTAPEVTVAAHCGLRVLGLSLVTNQIVTEWDSTNKANHEEVLAAGKSRSLDMQNFVTKLVEKMDD